MTIRERLPNRRQCESFGIFHSGVHFTVSAGSYQNGKLAEIFLSAERPGTPLEAMARDAAILASLAFQHGVDLQTIRTALTRDNDGGPATPLGAALDAITKDTPSLRRDGCEGN